MKTTIEKYTEHEKWEHIKIKIYPETSLESHLLHLFESRIQDNDRIFKEFRWVHEDNETLYFIIEV